MSTKKIYVQKHNETVCGQKVNTTRRGKLDTTVLSSDGGSVSSSQQKYLEHKFDIAYSKYLQTVALKRILAKKNEELERFWDEQLTYNSEIVQDQKDEINILENKVKHVPEFKELLSKLMFLDNILKSQLSDITSTKEIQALTQQLRNICDKLYLDGMKIDANVGDKLTATLGMLYEISNEIKEGTNEEYFNFIESIRKIEELSKKINYAHHNVVKNQKILNSLVLKASSMQLSKDEKDCSNEVTK